MTKGGESAAGKVPRDHEGWAVGTALHGRKEPAIGTATHDRESNAVGDATCSRGETATGDATHGNGENAMGNATHGSGGMPWGMPPMAGEKVQRGRLLAAVGRVWWGMLSVTRRRILVYPNHL